LPADIDRRERRLESQTSGDAGASVLGAAYATRPCRSRRPSTPRPSTRSPAERAD